MLPPRTMSQVSEYRDLWHPDLRVILNSRRDNALDSIHNLERIIDLTHPHHEVVRFMKRTSEPGRVAPVVPKARTRTCGPTGLTQPGSD